MSGKTCLGNANRNPESVQGIEPSVLLIRNSLARKRRAMIVSLQSGPSVTFPLLEFLQLHYGVRDLNYLQEPTPIPDGYETYIYRFQLQRAEGLPAALSRPLILKLYVNHHGEDR